MPIPADTLVEQVLHICKKKCELSSHATLHGLLLPCPHLEKTYRAKLAMHLGHTFFLTEVFGDDRVDPQNLQI